MVDVILASRHILGVLLDYLTIAVIIAIIYMLFQLVTGGNGIRGLFGGGHDRDDGGDHGDGQGGHGGGQGGGGGGQGGGGDGEGAGAPPPAAQEHAAQHAPGLDNAHPGRFRIRVVTPDGHPVPRTALLVHSYEMPMWRRLFRRPTIEHPIYRNIYTGPDGFWPSRVEGEVIGSGFIRITAHSPQGNARREAVIYPSNPETPGVQVIEVQVGGNDDELHFEPTELGVLPANGDADMVMQGVVN